MKIVLVSIGLVLFLADVFSWQETIPEAIELEKVVQQLQRKVVETPFDSQSYYLLGLAYYMAYYHKNTYIPGYIDSKSLEVSPRKSYDSKYLMNRFKNWDFESLDSPVEVNLELNIAHNFAKKAEENFWKAIEIEKDRDYFWLTLAELYECLYSSIKIYSSDKKQFPGVNKDSVRNLYWRAFEISNSEKNWDAEFSLGLGYFLMFSTGYKAALGYMRTGGGPKYQRSEIEAYLKRVNTKREYRTSRWR